MPPELEIAQVRPLVPRQPPTYRVRRADKGHTEVDPQRPSDMDDLLRKLKIYRLIRIVVGQSDEQKTFFMSQAVLEHNSEFFLKALRNEHLGPDEQGVLRVPEDNVKAWTILIYWMVNHKWDLSRETLCPRSLISKISSLDLCFACWALGEKYCMPESQDLIMLEILDVLDAYTADISEVKAVFESTIPGGKLRVLMAEEIAIQLMEQKDYGELDKVDGAVGFASMVAKELAVMAGKFAKGEKGYYLSPRLKKNSRRDRGKLTTGCRKWQDYMVRPSRGPVRHWIHQD